MRDKIIMVLTALVALLVGGTAPPPGHRLACVCHRREPARARSPRQAALSSWLGLQPRRHKDDWDRKAFGTHQGWRELVDIGVDAVLRDPDIAGKERGGKRCFPRRVYLWDYEQDRVVDLMTVKVVFRAHGSHKIIMAYPATDNCNLQHERVSLRDDFLDMLAPTCAWVPVGPGRYLVTEHLGVKIPVPAKLFLDERLFDRYVEWLILKGGDESVDDALGTIYFALDDALTSVPEDMVLSEVGLKAHLLHPVWFHTRIAQEAAEASPHTVWVGDPPL